jgi:EAL and modified HD-GYP domain-containing signal transduction protein
MSYDLAKKMDASNPDSYFTAGMLSILDALLDRPMGEILEKLPLSNEIRSALIDKSGEMGRVVDCVLNYEQGKWDDVLEGCNTDMAMNYLNDTYLSAVNTTESLQVSLAS